MDSTKLSPGITEALRDRYLLSPGLSNYPESVIMVAAGDAMGDQSAEINLMLVAPGLNGLDDLREKLCAWLKTLAGIDESWIYSAHIEPHFNHGEPIIVVEIDDASLCGDTSTARVLDAARVFLTPTAAINRRRIITLQGRQRFVPLDFRCDEYTPTKVELTLPDGLELVRACLTGVYSENVQQEAAAGLRVGLETALCKFTRVSGVYVRLSGHGKVTITVTLDTRSGFARAHQLNRLEGVIAQTVARHTNYSGGFFTWLVIEPARPHDDEIDEGGFLGPF